jgi:cyclic dehypoxanthinyl futalosine synthase
VLLSELNRISFDQGLKLFEEDLFYLGNKASKIKESKHPEDYITYVVDRNINYTNICSSGCKFCAFYKKHGDANGYVLSSEELFKKIDELISQGGTQILIQGGLHPEFSLTFYVDLLREIKSKFDIHIHGFSPPEIVHISKTSGKNFEYLIKTLQDAGLDTIPGGGAEILSDDIRSKISPNKCSSDEWLSVMRTAHKLGLRTTATMMFGHIENFSHRIEHFDKIRRLQDETGGFTAFIPWTFQSENTALELKPTGSYDYLRTLAICRIYLDNIDNIQASWVTQGAKIGQMALFFGANDMGSTMLEENVVKAAGVSFAMTESMIRALIEDAGFIPKKRDTYYAILSGVNRFGF